MHNRLPLFLLLWVTSLILPAQVILHPAGELDAGVGACPEAACGGTYKDDGGNTANYSFDIDNAFTICADQPNQCIRLQFTQFDIRDVDAAACGGCCDIMTIYDGPLPSATVLFTGCNTSPGTITSTNGCLTMRFVSDNTVNFPGWDANITCVPCAAGKGQSPNSNSDCSTPTTLCSDFLTSDISNGPGVKLEGCGGNSCLTGEIYSNWYRMVVQNTGTLEFTLQPNQAGEDFDFQVYGPNPDCNNLGDPIRCSFAAPLGTGATGLGNGATDLTEGGAGNGYVRRIDAIAGETYLLMVNKWSPIANVNNSYTIDYNGSAVLLPTPPVISPDGGTICQGDSITLTVSPADNYTWTSVPPGFSATGSSVKVSPAVNTEYKVTLNSCASTRDSVVVVVSGSAPAVPAPINGPAQVCNPSGNVVYSIPRIANADGYIWTISGAGTIITNNNDTSVTVSWTGNGSLCVQSRNDCDTSLTRCLSVTMGSNGSTPVAVDKVSCGVGNDTFSITGCSGIIKWYTTALSVPVLYTGNPYVVSLSASTTYFATCTDNGCESARIPVTVTVNNLSCDDGCALTTDIKDAATCSCTHIPPTCDDGCPLTSDSWDAANCQCISTPPNTDDGCALTTDSWDAANCAVIHAPPSVDDGCPLTTDSWDAANCQVVNTPPNIDDGCALTVDSWDLANCVEIHTPPNPDDGCPQTTDTWDAANCQVINTPPSSCDDGCDLTTDTWDIPSCNCAYLPANALDISDTLACVEQDVILAVSGPEVPTATYSWQVSNVGAISGYGPHTVAWSAEGTEKVILNITQGSCSIVDSADISVLNIAITSFGDTLVAVGSTLVLEAVVQSSGTTSVKWYDGSGNLLCSSNSCSVIPGAASQEYLAIATDQNDCTDSVTVLVLTEQGNLAFMPTGFSPNGDGENDRLVVLGGKVAVAVMKVFNRWGEKVYEGDAKSSGWDGTFMGEPAPLDVYSYAVEVIYLDGEKTVLKGVIALLR